MHRHAGAVATPVGVRTRLLTLLAEEAARGEGAMATGTLSSRRSGLRALRRPAIWIPMSLAAGVAFALVIARGFGMYPFRDVNVVYREGGIAEFDVASAYFDKFDHHFAPNVPSSSFGDISFAYVDAHMPGFIWNFNSSGLTLMGGRLDKLPDGRPVTFTYYQGEQRALLCVRYKVADFVPPPGAVHEMAGHLFYRYHGYAICYSYSPIGKFACVLISRGPVDELVETVEYALQ
ncbi:MAG TPA: hypothetical protein VMT64_00350 [Candidatus Binataceae bacterium]|nr:hypothetical protein [Candidatus Binataceae bacterium]